MAITYDEAELLDEEFIKLEGNDYPGSLQQKAFDALNAWEKLWSFMVREKNYTPHLGSKLIDWQIGNWAWMAIDNLIDAKLYQELILVCEQILKIKWDKGDELFHENAKREIADAYASMGDYERCLNLYRQYLKDDPLWSWGWIGYYRQLHEHNDEEEFRKVLDSLYERVQKGEKLRDIKDLLYELSYEYEKLGEAKVSENLNRRLRAVKSKY